MPADEAEQRHIYFHALRDTLGIGHWNTAGHRAAGERIAAWLAQELAGGALRATSPGRISGSWARRWCR